MAHQFLKTVKELRSKFSNQESEKKFAESSYSKPLIDTKTLLSSGAMEMKSFANISNTASKKIANPAKYFLSQPLK